MRTRIGFAISFFAVPLLLAILLTANAGCGPKAPPQHLVLLTVDTLRADYVLSNQAGVPLTPYLRSFADSSIRFTNAISVGAMTAPGVAGFLTGLYPRRSGVIRNTHIIQPQITTLAERLSDAGFITGGFVANPVVREGFGFAQGFQEYQLLPSKPPYRYANAKAVNAAALEWVRTVDTSQRMFLWVHYMEPHGPYQPLRRCREPFDIDAFGQPAEVELLPPGNNSGLGGIAHYQYRAFDPPPTDGRDYLLRYAAQVRCIDAGIGQIIEDLRAIDVLENAVVVITADHGEAMLDDNGYFFSHANELTQDQIAVPLFLRAPTIDGGVTIDRVVSTTGIVPTAMRILGLEPPTDLDGTDLLASEELPVVSTRNADSSVRLGEWKLVRKRKKKTTSLFNIVDDPGQTTDLASARPDIVESLGGYLDQVRKRPVLAKPISRHDIDDQTRESLVALGYLTD